MIRGDRLMLVISQVVLDEFAGAPARVRDILNSLPAEHIEFVALTPEVIALRDAYMAAKVVGTRWRQDALHVAAASVTGVDAIVSWNFKHIVRLDKISAYNAVNEREGYRHLTIITLLEVTRA